MRKYYYVVAGGGALKSGTVESQDFREAVIKVDEIAREAGMEIKHLELV